MGDIADKLMDWMQTNVPEAMTKVGDALLEETRGEISEPYALYGSGTNPFPHLRQGFLADGLHIQRDAGVSVVQDMFVSTRQVEVGHSEVPQILHDGTPAMTKGPYPYMDILYERVVGFYLDDVVSELRSRLSQ